MLYDMRLAPEALKGAARWVAWRCEAPETPVTVTRSGQSVLAEVRGHHTDIFIGSGRDAGSGKETIGLTRAALWAAAEWAEAGEYFADVYLLIDDRMLLVYQGDDVAGFDTDGSPASGEYLAVAPLDR